jgi:hypothetical protein
MSRFTLAFAVVAALVLVSASRSSAQVIYEPVQYQYGSPIKYYYGGQDPRVIEAAEAYASYRNAYHADGRHPDPFSVAANAPTVVYHDLFPYQNAALYGYTPMDAMNEAYANVPRYFHKSDLIGPVR